MLHVPDGIKAESAGLRVATGGRGVFIAEVSP